jgi:hypothetical protein
MNTTSKDDMGFPPISMLSFSGNKEDVARFVADLLVHSKVVLQSTTIITRGSSEDCYVRIVIDTSSEGIVLELAPIYCLQRINT